MFFGESIAFGFIGILVGYFIGNRLAIGRDRRREFNDSIRPIRILLLNQRGMPTPYSISPTNIEFSLIREKLPFWKRKGFDRTLEKYQKSKGTDNQKSGQMGEVFYKDTARIVHDIDDLLKVLKPK